MSVLVKLFLRGLLSFVAVFCSRACSTMASLVLALRTNAEDTFMASQVFLEALSSQRDILGSRNLPPFLERDCDGSRSPVSSTRLCAVIHLCEGQLESRAARRRHRAGGPVKMGVQPRVCFAGPWPSWGPAGVFCYIRLVFRLAGSQLKFFERRKNGERAVERTNGWVGGVFTDSPKT